MIELIFSFLHLLNLDVLEAVGKPLYKNMIMYEPSFRIFGSNNNKPNTDIPT